MINNEQIAGFMGKVETTLEAIQDEMRREFKHVNDRLDRGDKRFAHLEDSQRDNSRKISQIFTGIWVGRAIGGAILGIASFFGIDQYINRGG